MTPQDGGGQHARQQVLVVNGVVRGRGCGVGGDGGRREQVGGVVRAGREAGGMGGAVERVQVRVQVRHVVGGCGSGRRRGLRFGPDQGRVAVDGEVLVLVEDQRALGGLAAGRHRLEAGAWTRGGRRLPLADAAATDRGGRWLNAVVGRGVRVSLRFVLGHLRRRVGSRLGRLQHAVRLRLGGHLHGEAGVVLGWVVVVVLVLVLMLVVLVVVEGGFVELG